MFKKIKKRDGEIVEFDSTKITTAIFKAGKATREFKEWKAKRLTYDVLSLADKLNIGSIPCVEYIQDLIERVLLDSKFNKTAKAYIIYREKRANVRAITTKANVDLVDNYIQKLDWKIKENSNMCYSLQGLNNYISSDITSEYWLNKIYPEEIRDAHNKGDIHIHDLGLLANYCCGWSLQDLLKKGFRGVSGKIASDPPRHFRSAIGQIVNFFYTLQGEAAGAQAFSNFDTLLAPFVHYDNLDYREVKQAIQEFVFNMNVPTRVGSQTPFTNITMDLQAPSTLKDQPVFLGEVEQWNIYSDFQAEMDMINEAFAEVMMSGDADGRVFTFPIPTYNITKDFDWDNPNLKKLWKMTGKYGIPYFSNFINSDMSPDQVTSMCPLAADEKILIKSSIGREVCYSKIRHLYNGDKKNYEVYSDGEFIKGKFNKFSNQQMLKVILDNGHEIKISTKHLNFVLKGNNYNIEEIQGKYLKPGMYLPYSLNKYEGEGGIPDFGYFIGAYAGDGSFDGDTSVIFSLNDYSKKEVIVKLQKISLKYFGTKGNITKSKTSKLVTLRINSKAAVGLCRDYVADKERNKHYRAKLFVKSLAFREAVLKGHHDTDGGNRHRIYTSSLNMINSLNMLAATLGTTTSIYKDDRDGRFGKEPNYAVLIYRLNREKYGDLWFKKYQKLWMKIKEIKTIKNNTAYCFESDNDNQIFTVGTTGILTHNCRLRLSHDELEIRGGGLFGSAPLTGSTGVVTINLPRIGYRNRSAKGYIEKLTQVYNLAVKSLVIKRKILEQFTEKNLYPYSKYYLADTKQRTGKYWKNHFSTIGIIGMNESCLNLFREDIGSKKGQKFAIKIMDILRSMLKNTQKETGDIFNLEATPGEGISYSLPLKDKKQYPRIICANENDYRNGAAPYYSNSTQLSVNYTDDIFEMLDLQDELQTKYTGGTVSHLFLGEQVTDTEVVKNLIKKIFTNYKLPYLSLTPTFSICPSHGYIQGRQEKCPNCAQETEVYSRVVGYLRPEKQYNNGKRSEFKDRKTYSI